MAHRLKVSGRMVDGMGWELRHVDDGFIVENGPVDRKVAMVFGKVQRQTPNTKGRGRVDYRMVTVRKHTLMEV